MLEYSQIRKKEQKMNITLNSKSEGIDAILETIKTVWPEASIDRKENLTVVFIKDIAHAYFSEFYETEKGYFYALRIYDPRDIKKPIMIELKYIDTIFGI